VLVCGLLRLKTCFRNELVSCPQGHSSCCWDAVAAAAAAPAAPVIDKLTIKTKCAAQHWTHFPSPAEKRGEAAADKKMKGKKSNFL